MKISVIGTGYLGAVHAVCMAHIGHDVIAVDVDSKKIELLSSGAPASSNIAKKSYPYFNYSDSIKDSAINSDTIFILTGWQEYFDVDPSEIDQVVRNKIIIDARNFLNYHKWIDKGWTYRALGRPNL